MSILIFRTYAEPSTLEIQEHQRSLPVRTFVPTFHNSLQPVQSDLIDALASMLAAHTEYAEAWQLLRTNPEHIVPYVYCYHHRTHLEATSDQANA